MRSVAGIAPPSFRSQTRLTCVSETSALSFLMDRKRHRGEYQVAQITVKAEAVLAARPQDVYATIADYHHGHPAIIPQGTFSDLRVEQGGFGAGTIIRFKMRIFGAEQSYYQRVSEPEPGRRLVEQDIDSVQHVATTFTVLPRQDGQQSHVEIATTMDTSAGLRGWIERLMIPLAIPRIYRQELALLEVTAQKRDELKREWIEVS